MMRWRTAVVVCALLFCMPTAARAQSDGLEIGAVSSTDYPTIEVTVTVPPELAQISLPPDAFEVIENGESRGRPSLGSTDVEEPAPPRTVLAIDTSRSMEDDPLEEAREAAQSFVQSLRAGSEVAIVTFGDTLKVETDFTADVGAILDRLAAIRIDPTSGTVLYDGVRRAHQLLQRVGGAPESIVVLSDGGDTDSATSRRQVVEELRGDDVRLWAVSLETLDSEPDVLADLAGSPERVLSAANADELEEIYVSIASDVSRQYLLRYDSEAAGRTNLAISLDYLNVDTTQSRDIVVDSTPQQRSSAESPAVRSPTPFVVTIPVLGTTTAYMTGLAALAVGSLLIWLLILAPRGRVTTRERLLATAGSRQRPRLSNVAEWATDHAERRLRRGRLGGVLDRSLEGAGLDVRPGELLVMVLSSMVVAYAVGVVIAGPLLGIILAAMLPIAVRLGLSILQDRRQAAFADQITDVLQLMAGTLRAGYGLLQGIDAVSRDAEDPAASEFRRIIIENRLGRDLNEAMDNCAARMNNDDFAWVVQAISIHRDVGGDLAEVLDNIIATVRARSEVHRQVRTLSAEGRLSAIILTALPFLMLAVIQIISPDYIAELTSRAVGWVMLGVAGLLLLIGTMWIRRMVKIRY